MTENTATFDFGMGNVPAHQHVNGGGWVADTATVADTAYVGPGARVYGNACVCDNAHVSGNATVAGNAHVYGNAIVRSNACVGDNAHVSGNAIVAGDTRVSSNCSITPVFLSGLGEYSVTICDSVITIGCTTDTLDGWLTHQDLAQAPQLATHAEAISIIARCHQLRVKGP